MNAHPQPLIGQFVIYAPERRQYAAAQPGAYVSSPVHAHVYRRRIIAQQVAGLLSLTTRSPHHVKEA